MKITRLTFALLTALGCFVLFAPETANAQRRDYLTDAEIELVRDNQSIDLRIGVLTKAIDRRLQIIKNDGSKPGEKENSSWGEPPQGTRLELLSDIEKLLQKAIDDIDEVASRKMDGKLFPKAMNKLTASCQSYLPQFRMFIDTAADEKERGILLGSIEHCNSVIAASSKVPKEEAKKEEAKEEKKKKN